jgi:hypothetical protein
MVPCDAATPAPETGERERLPLQSDQKNGFAHVIFAFSVLPRGSGLRVLSGLGRDRALSLVENSTDPKMGLARNLGRLCFACRNPL